MKNRHISIKITDSAKEYIVNEGYKPQFGARPLKRVLQRKVETLLSKSIISDEIKEGSAVIIDVENDELIIRN